MIGPNFSANNYNGTCNTGCQYHASQHGVGMGMGGWNTGMNYTGMNTDPNSFHNVFQYDIFANAAPGSTTQNLAYLLNTTNAALNNTQSQFLPIITGSLGQGTNSTTGMNGTGSNSALNNILASASINTGQTNQLGPNTNGISSNQSLNMFLAGQQNMWQNIKSGGQFATVNVEELKTKIKNKQISQQELVSVLKYRGVATGLVSDKNFLESLPDKGAELVAAIGAAGISSAVRTYAAVMNQKSDNDSSNSSERSNPAQTEIDRATGILSGIYDTQTTQTT